MAQSERFFEDVKKHLECPVCHEMFSQNKEPKILNCLHTFCKTCLEGWIRQQQRDGELSCPTCRQITKCINNEITTLPSHRFCKQLIEIVEAYSGEGQEDSPRCGNCKEKKSLKFYCSDCNFFLCEECVAFHRNWKSFSGHNVKEIGNMQSSDVQDYARRANVCKMHKDEFRYFCEKCQICICRDCAILEHPDSEGHRKAPLEVGLEKNRSEIESAMRIVEGNSTLLKTKKDSLEVRRQQINNSIEKATMEVKRVANKCIDLIRQHEASVTEQLVEHKTAFQGAFRAQMTSLENRLEEIDNTLTFCEDVLVRKNLPEILNIKTTIKQRLEELSLPAEFNFTPNVDYRGIKYFPNDVPFLKDAPGKLVTTNTVPSLSVAEGKNLTESFVGADCTFTVTTKDSAGRKTYSEMDEIEIKITSLNNENDMKPVLTNLKDGRYTVSFKPKVPAEYTVSIEVGGSSIMGSPFKLKVTTRGSKFKSTESIPVRSNLSRGRSKIINSAISTVPLKKGTCPICLDIITKPRTLKCKDVFCSECIQEALKLSYKCPICNDPQGVVDVHTEPQVYGCTAVSSAQGYSGGVSVEGNQPEGTMTSTTDRFSSVPGNEDYGLIIINYRFPRGTQGLGHPNPGKSYNGMSLTAFLPDSPEGREVLQLLRRAFDAKLLFTIASSGPHSNQIIENGVHHKPSKHGEPDGFGYPYADYLPQVKIELAAKGIYSEVEANQQRRTWKPNKTL